MSASSADTRGLIIVQIDGMSRPVLDALLSSGRMPVLGTLVSSGRLTLGSWAPLLPPCTPASQAGILHGDNEEVPGFRWFEKTTRRLFVANRAKDAAEIERRLSSGNGLLADGGVSVGNLLAGDAAYSHLTMATIDGEGSARPLSERGGYPRSPRPYLRILYEMVGELFDEIVQARRQRLDDVRPRMPRGARYALERVITNVPLRILSTSIVIREVQRGRPIIYVDFTGYDEIAHHCGPGRPEAYGAAAKIDRSIGHILDAVATAPRAYQLVVLSDHGQSLGASFRQRYGISLARLIAAWIGVGATFHAALQPREYADSLTRVLHHLLVPRVASVVARLLIRRRGIWPRLGRRRTVSGASVSPSKDTQVADVVVCASGNLGLIYFSFSPGRMTREEIQSRYPGLIEALVHHPGIGMLVLRSEHGIVALGAGGTNFLDEKRVVGRDPVAPYGSTAAAGLMRVAGFENSGDIIAIGAYSAETGEVVSLEELVGSHGGLGGPQGEAFIAFPSSWRLEVEPLIGSPAINSQLRRWMADLAIQPGWPARSEGQLQRPGHPMNET